MRRPSPDPIARAAQRLGGLGRPALLLAGIWTLGLIALGAVVAFENRADKTRRAQVVIAQMKNQAGAILAIAFNPAIAGASNVPARAQTAQQLAGAKGAYNASLATLAASGRSDAPARIGRESGRYFTLIDDLSELVATGRSQQAALALGASERPGGVEARLQAELARADRAYGADATRSREVGSIGTVIAILFLLAGFSVALLYSVRAHRHSHHDATTDGLTGLGNRRKLFADMEHPVDGDEALTVGMFDLDGFKAFNDTFGHPAGDALLARLGARLIAALDGRGNAYRTGGDEFVVITAAADGEQLMVAAQAALSERGAGFAIGCSRGSSRILAGITLEQALHVADQRLYADKRSTAIHLGSDAKDALLQVLAEQSETLVTHLGHVAELAARTATGMQLAPRQVELTRLAAELHDVGKSAIPMAILEKASALDAEERLLMQRHSVIGERILTAVPTLHALGSIVRAVHERPDGAGYPDGLTHEEIPMSARIIAVVDAFDAMTNDRPYRRALPTAGAIAELRRQAGAQFDAAVVEAFAEALANPLAAPRAA
jgi:diguanylate cyclase (GGDEF)-like protein